MSQRPVLHVEKNAFANRRDVYRDLQKTGYWPTTYISGASPELPVHWHDGDIIGYLVEGETYVVNEKGERCDLQAGDKLVIPAGALHAEGTVTDPVTYIVTLKRCEPFMEALRMLDPAAYPNPELLALDPELLAALGVLPPAG